MAFGTHGRKIVLASLLAASSTVVFSGIAGADSGTIKVNEPGATSNANDPHLLGACVGLNAVAMPGPGPLKVTFSTQSPTKGNYSYTTTMPAGGSLDIDLHDWLATLPAG